MARGSRKLWPAVAAAAFYGGLLMALAGAPPRPGASLVLPAGDTPLGEALRDHALRLGLEPCLAGQVVGSPWVRGDVTPAAGPETVAALNLSSGEGCLFVLASTAWGPLVLAAASGFSRIERISVEALTGQGAGEILVYDHHDESTGAFFEQRALVILKWRAGELVPIFRQELWREEYSLDPPLAERRVMVAEVDLPPRPAGPLQVRGLTLRERRVQEGVYSELDRRAWQRRLRWNGQVFRYLPEA